MMHRKVSWIIMNGLDVHNGGLSLSDRISFARV